MRTDDNPRFVVTSLDLPTPECLDRDLYCARGQDENFFRIWKSGCRVEALQLGTLERLARAFVIYLIIAWRILHRVTWGRDCPVLPCDVVFDPEEWQAAWIVAHRTQPPETPPPLGPDGTADRPLWGLSGAQTRRSSRS